MLNQPWQGTTVAGREFRRTVSFSDPGTDAWTVTVDYDGAGPLVPVVVPLKALMEGELESPDVKFDPAYPRQFTLAHTYGANGVYPVNVTVSDGAQFDTESFSVTVTNQRPAIASPIRDLGGLRTSLLTRFRYVDLNAVFQDPDHSDSELTFTIDPVTGNTNPSFVRAYVESDD